MSQETIYASIEAANDVIGKCRRALIHSGGYHWWYIDGEEEEKGIGDDGFSRFDYIACMCKTCGTKMRLSVNAAEFPAI